VTIAGGNVSGTAGPYGAAIGARSGTSSVSRIDVMSGSFIHFVAIDNGSTRVIAGEENVRVPEPRGLNMLIKVVFRRPVLLVQ
jgi:hypothetical protein